MEKMGWEKGKGLGANEDGMKDHVSVQLKSDTKGVGCSKSYADNWIAHQDDFNTLLSQLNTEAVTESDKVQSLEKKSKQSKGRVHYQKFTRGKDLSSAQGKDLDCIFGRRKSKSAPVTPKSQSEDNSEAEDEVHSEGMESSGQKVDHSHGFTTVSSGTSVADYFAKKMADMKARSLETISKQDKSTCDDLDKSALKEGDGAGGETSLNNHTIIVDDDGQGSVKKAKKKKRTKNKDIDDADEPSSESFDKMSDEYRTLKKKKKKSKKDDFDDSLDEMPGVEYSSMELCATLREKNKSKSTKVEADAPVVEEADKVDSGLKKKMKKKKRSAVSECDTPDKTSICANEEALQFTEGRKTKKDDSLKTSLPVSVKQEGETPEKVSVERKKGKKRRAIIVEEPVTEKSNDHDEPAIKKPKLKKQRKSDKKKEKQKEKKKKMKAHDSIADAFEGSNLSMIKGYGDGKGIGYSQKFASKM